MQDITGTRVHPTAIIEDGAVLADGVSVGAYSVIGAQAQLAAGVVVETHVVIAGATRIGENTRIYPFASIGHAPQDLKYAGEESRLIIGADCTIREHVTMNPGTAGDALETRIGDRCLFMAGAHVAHDCTIGDDVILVNHATLGGHAQIADRVIIGGLSAVHQFVRVGVGAFVGGMSGVENDIIPYGSAIGNRASLGGLNLVGLKRAGIAREEIHALRRAYRDLFETEAPLGTRIDRIAREYDGRVLVEAVVDFVRASSNRALCTPRRMRAGAPDKRQ